MKNEGQKNVTVVPLAADERRRLATSRSDCYGLLALVFRDVPTAETIAQLTAPPLAEALSRLGYDIAQDLAGELDMVTRHSYGFRTRRIPRITRKMLISNCANVSRHRSSSFVNICAYGLLNSVSVYWRHLPAFFTGKWPN